MRSGRSWTEESNSCVEGHQEFINIEFQHYFAKLLADIPWLPPQHIEETHADILKEFEIWQPDKFSSRRSRYGVHNIIDGK